MPRKKATAEPKSSPLFIPTDLLNRLRIVAAHRKCSMVDLINKYTRPAVDREYRRICEEIEREAEEVELGEAGA